MKKILFSLLFLSILFCGCSWNNQTNHNDIDQHKNESVQSSILYPANNYIGNSFVAENDRYITYANPDRPLEGIYLYDKHLKTTVKIYNKYASNLVVGTNGIYFDDAGRLIKVDFLGGNTKEIVSNASMFTAYDYKIYYSCSNNLYELDMETDSVKIIAQGEKVFTETDMSMQFQNLCIGDRIYFSSSINKNGERVAVLMALDSDGTASKIHECISLVNIAVYDNGFLYFEDKNGLARVNADGSGLEERLVSESADGESCDSFYVYDGKWYYQKYTKDRSRLFCMNSADNDEHILLDLNAAKFGAICKINQTENYIFFIMTDPEAKGNNYNYLGWILDRNNYTDWRIGEKFK